MNERIFYTHIKSNKAVSLLSQKTYRQKYRLKEFACVI